MPDQNNDEGLRDRVRRLEERVRELEQQVDQQHGGGPATRDTSGGHQQAADGHQKEAGSPLIPNNIRFGEQWLNRIGIGLLLFGVVFLFKYTIDQGWLIPPVRSAIGLGIGGLLFSSGRRMREEMNPFRQVLLGGGIAVFYITGFATYQLYSFMPASVIWAFMIVVTLLALSMSLRQDEAILSVTGTLGALGTPFMLYSGSGSLVMLMLYTALVLGAGAVIYFRKGWNALLWSMLAGGLGVMGVGVIASLMETRAMSLTDHWVLQAGMAGWALATWGTAVAREVSTGADTSDATVHLSVFWVSLGMLPLVAMHWELSGQSTALVAFGFAGAGALGYLRLNPAIRELAITHAFMGLIMLTVGVVLYFSGTPLFVLLAAEAVALRYIAHLTGDIKLDIGAHILFVAVVIWTFNGLWLSAGVQGLDVRSVVQLIFLIAGGTILPRWLRRNDFKLLYRVVVHLMLLFWIHQVLVGFAGGQAWVSVVWGVYAIGLLVAGFVRNEEQVRLTGMVTIFLVVAKLFLVDLSQLQALWRILLFIGFGGVFVLLGYYLQSRWSE
ncbi:Predicted membrane protein [Fodinibius roseus]|uniref:Predicted membrane protein n=1 Tax=Fodinibius roseus TaxID=1194090 RepID=A0A1M5M5V0_9BACT|nr:DUF2339 domain-containing protein [Fodinibius roseus]SHG72319.1 Predicted membrane protein [Fodinibius roseus]